MSDRAPERADVLLVGGTYVTVDRERRILGDGALAVRDGAIVALGPRADVAPRFEAAETIDASNRYVFPGLVNTHTHLFQTLLKGLGDDRVLVDWFRQMTGPAAVELTEEDCYLGALLGSIEAIRSGTTTIKDFMYVHPRPGLTDAVAQAFQEIGIRGVIGRGFADAGLDEGVPPPLVEDLDEALADCERVIGRYHGSGLLSVYVAPVMIWAVSERGIREAAALCEARGVGFAMHLSETCFERSNAKHRFGHDDFLVLADAGALGPSTLAIHCVHADESDLKLMAEQDVKVSHNPTSNMYLGSGVAPIPRMLELGITVGLATDGPASNNNQNMVEALKFGALLHKVQAQDPRVITAEKAVEMATIDGARALGLDRLVGSLEPGKRADLFIADFSSPNASPVHNPASTLVFSATGSEVKTVLVDGNVVLRHGELVGINEADVVARTQRAADDLVRRAGIENLKSRPWQSFALGSPRAGGHGKEAASA